MRCLAKFLVLTLLLSAGVAILAQSPTYHLGRTPSQQEIEAWDKAVAPDGKELPPGKGTAKEGAKLFAERCAGCHGPTGEMCPPGHTETLVGGKGTLTTIHEVRTVGSFYPFSTTVWDYINSSMPPNQPGSLTADDVYALTAFLFFRNGIIQENDVLDAKTLPKIQMPNRNGFVPPIPKWKPGVSKPYGQYVTSPNDTKR
jgi:cytochrome c